MKETSLSVWQVPRRVLPFSNFGHESTSNGRGGMQMWDQLPDRKSIAEAVYVWKIIKTLCRTEKQVEQLRVLDARVLVQVIRHQTNTRLIIRRLDHLFWSCRRTNQAKKRIGCLPRKFFIFSFWVHLMHRLWLHFGIKDRAWATFRSNQHLGVCACAEWRQKAFQFITRNVWQSVKATEIN